MAKRKDPPAAKGDLLSTEAEAPTTLEPIERDRGDVVSRLDTGYIAGTAQYPFIRSDIALPMTIDDAEREYGIDIYERMKREPILAAIERVIKIVVLADGLTIAPRYSKPEDQTDAEKMDAWQKSEEMAEYVRAAIDRLGKVSRPIMRTLWNLLDAPRLGHKLAEIVYDFIPDGPFAGALGIAEFQTKPRQNYVFVLDERNRFRGVIAKVPGGSIALRTGLVYDVSQIPNAIAPEKLVILTLDDEDGDPRGVSWWRPLWDPWYRKQILKPEHMKTGVQFGGGMISVELPEKAESVSVKDPSGGEIRDRGTDGRVTLLASTLWTAQQLRNGGVGVFHNGTTVTVHTPKADSKFFDESFDMLDREMVTAFLLSARSILEAQHGSKADTDTSADLLDELKMFVRSRLCEVLTDGPFYTLVKNSYGPEMAQYSPIARMQRTSRPDFAGNAGAVAQLSAAIDALEISRNQKEYLKTEILGMPPTDTDPADETAAKDPSEVDSETWAAITELAASTGTDPAAIAVSMGKKPPADATPKPAEKEVAVDKKSTAGFRGDADRRRLSEIDGARFEAYRARKSIAR